MNRLLGQTHSPGNLHNIEWTSTPPWHAGCEFLWVTGNHITCGGSPGEQHQLEWRWRPVLSPAGLHWDKDRQPKTLAKSHQHNGENTQHAWSKHTARLVIRWRKGWNLSSLQRTVWIPWLTRTDTHWCYVVKVIRHVRTHVRNMLQTDTSVVVYDVKVIDVLMEYGTNWHLNCSGRA